MQARIAAAAATLAALAGCASMNSITSEVSSYGSWPTDRAPGRYAIERLPSQQAHAGAMQDSLEASARAALEQAGFKPAADSAPADVMVQIGARATRTEATPWGDPLWWRWGPPYWRRPGYDGRTGWGWPPGYEAQYDQEVGLLIRDRRSGTPLYEARAASTSMASPSPDLLAAMFQAALKDFPSAVPQPHRVAVQLGAPAR